jgi:DNA-binding MarR family transcriptional regulator
MGISRSIAVPAKQEFQRHAGFMLAQLGRAVTRRYRAAMAPSGLNPRETAALVQLRDAGTVSQQTLGTTLDIDASNLVVLLNDLEVEGLIARRRDLEDRRRHVVEITPAGTALVDEVLRTAAQVEDEFFASLDEDERATLRELLCRVAQSTDDPSATEVTGADC